MMDDVAFKSVSPGDVQVDKYSPAYSLGVRERSSLDSALLIKFCIKLVVVVVLLLDDKAPFMILVYSCDSMSAAELNCCFGVNPV